MRKPCSALRFFVWTALIVLTLLTPAGVRPLAQGPGREIVLVENLWSGRDSHLGPRLASQGIDVLEDYGSFALVSVNDDQRKALKRTFDVTAMPDRTMTGRGAFSFDTRKGEPVLPGDLRADPAQDSSYRTYIVQFVGPIKQEWIQTLESTGVEVFDYLPSYSYIVDMDAATAARVRRLPYVQWVGIYHPAYKLSRPLLGAETSDRPVNVFLFPRRSTTNLEALLAGWGASIDERWTSAGGQALRTSLAPERARSLARLPEVSWIDEEARTSVPSNNLATWVDQSNQPNIYSIFDKGIHGENQVIGVADGGVDGSTHPAFGEPNKITHVDISQCPGHSTISPHGTNVASVLAGNEAPYDAYNLYDGHAFAAKLVNIDLSVGAACNPGDWYTGVYPEVYSRGAFILAQGATFDGNCSTQPYSDRARQADQYVWEHKDFLITVAAGNFFNGNPNNQFNEIKQEGNAKSVLAVGATWNSLDADKMASYSGHGAACDGRIKPDIVAPGGDGTSLLCVASPCPTPPCTNQCTLGSSTDPYGMTSGTSFSHPAIAGDAALVRQYFTEGWYPTGVKNGSAPFYPSAALVRAVLTNGAVQMQNETAIEGCPSWPLCCPPSDPTCDTCPPCSCPTCNPTAYPNRIQGWGRVNLDNSLYFSSDPSTQKLTVIMDLVPGQGFSASGQVAYFKLPVTTSAPLKLTLAWSDYPGTVGSSGTQLRNDLNLIVTDPACTTYRGNYFSGGQSITGGAADSKNVLEEVIKAAPTTGVWTVKVQGLNVPFPDQPYALVSTGATGSPIYFPNRLAASESRIHSTITSGTYVRTQAEDSVYETLKEVLVGGVSVLEHVYVFDVSSLGTCLTLHVKGNRPGNSDGDNFQFYWSDSLNGTYTPIPSAIIQLPAEQIGGVDYPFTWPGTAGTIYIKIKDTAAGTHLDTVNIDHLEIR